MLPILNMISSIFILVLITMVFFSLYDLFRLKNYYHCITLLFERKVLFCSFQNTF